MNYKKNSKYSKKTLKELNKEILDFFKYFKPCECIFYAPYGVYCKKHRKKKWYE